MPEDAERSGDEANRLYWRSELSVGEVAERLGISRRALYDAIEPASAGVACSECGANMVYPGRSARDSGHPECPECGAGGDLDIEDLRRVTADAGSAMRRGADRREAEAAEGDSGSGRRMGGDASEAEQDAYAGSGAPLDTAAALDRGRAMLIGGAAVAGAALGAAAVLLLGRRGR